MITGDIRLPQRDVNDFILAPMAFARSSDGAILDDPPLPGANPPHVELPLELAIRTGNLVVASHTDLRELGPRWGAARTIVVAPREFAEKVDAARRAR